MRVREGNGDPLLVVRFGSEPQSVREPETTNRAVSVQGYQIMQTCLRWSRGLVNVSSQHEALFRGPAAQDGIFS